MVSRMLDRVKSLVPRQRKMISFAEIRTVKAAARNRDTIRLARRDVTQASLQVENALFKHCDQFRILNLTESMRFFRRVVHSHRS